MLLAAGYTKAQTKIGYLSFNDLVVSMPQYKDIQGQMQTYNQQFIDELNAMRKEGQDKLTAYDGKKATMTDAERSRAEGELQDIQNRIETEQTKAQNAVQAKQNELFKPLVDKLKETISQVAKEKGYTYVIDSSTADLLIVAPPGDDLLAAVKAKLGVSATATPAAAPAAKPAAKPAAAPKK
jgi:outer membrane protein